jgi:hypothetical protein
MGQLSDDKEKKMRRLLLDSEHGVCPDCGRTIEKNPEHFIPKCMIQHEMRNRSQCIKDELNGIKNELKRMEDFTDFYCSHCEELEEESKCQNQEL